MQIKFISLNIWKGGLLFDKVLDFLKKEKADIVALQEVLNSSDPARPIRDRSYSALKESLDYPYSAFSSAFLEKRANEKIPWGNAVFSKYPIIRNRRFFYDIPFGEVNLEAMTDFTFVPRILQEVDIQVGQSNISVFNNHGIWGQDGRDNKRRLKMGGVIARRIKYELRIILAGDFNMDPETKTITKIEKHVQSVFKSELQTTFNLLQKKEDKWDHFAVDMMFVSPSIKVIEHNCPKVDISDHLPLTALLEIV